MYVKGTSSSDTLFVIPTNELNANTLFSKPTDIYGNDYSYYTPVSYPPNSVKVASSTSLLSSIYDAANSSIENAYVKTTYVRSFLNSAGSLLDDLKSIAESAADSSLSSEARTELKKEADAITEKIQGYYQNASLDSEMLLQGGTSSYAAGGNGEAISYKLGDLSLLHLGIDNLDFSSAETSTEALRNINGAADNVTNQIDLMNSERSVMDARMQANSSSLATVQSAVYSSLESSSSVSYENARAAVLSDLQFALGVQASGFSGGTFSTLFDSLSKTASRFSNLSTSKSSAASSTAEEKSSAASTVQEESKAWS